MFLNRQEAGRQLASRLCALAPAGALVLGLPRGGVILAAEVANAIPDADLDVCLVRKLGVPWQPELALGALAEGGVRVLDSNLIRELGISEQTIDKLTRTAEAEIETRRALYRPRYPAVAVEGRYTILVDDGLATGATMLAAVRTLRARGASKIVAAAAVAPAEVVDWLAAEADEVVCLATPDPFIAVGSWFEDFRQVEDTEVLAALDAAFRKRS